MEVTKIENSDVWKLLFGLPIMLALIVLVSISVGHLITARSDRPTNVQVSAAAPKIDVNVPSAPAPHVTVSPSQAKIDVNVPAQTAPIVHVSTPPAVVTVLEKIKPEPLFAPVPTESKSSPEPVVPKAVPMPPKTVPKEAVTVPAFKDEDLTLDTLYLYAEKYVESYCKKNSLDPATEKDRWLKKWKQSSDQAVTDGIDSSEQSYIDRIVVQKRDCFDIEKATPEQIVEGCRIMLRYRDGKLAWLKALRDAATNEHMKKTLVFLAAGVR